MTALDALQRADLNLLLTMCLAVVGNKSSPDTSVRKKQGDYCSVECCKYWIGLTLTSDSYFVLYVLMTL